jgi:hypothetical protein
MIIDSSFVFKNLNEFLHDFDWLLLLSRYTKTSEFNDKAWIRIENESFRIFNASFIWRATIDFRISFMILRIATNHWIIVDEKTFISIMREYVSKMSNVSINSLSSTKSFNALNVICSVEFESMSEIFAMMIAYILRNESWYRSIISIEWCVSIDIVFILTLMLNAYCLNFRTMNCLLAFEIIRSNDSK